MITSEHRFVPGKMYGGWGSHLGHLVRDEAGVLWFADDACSQQGADLCDVLKNFRLGLVSNLDKGGDYFFTHAEGVGAQQVAPLLLSRLGARPVSTLTTAMVGTAPKLVVLVVTTMHPTST
jgi:hypothetical protein